MSVGVDTGVQWAPAGMTYEDAYPRGIFTYVMKVASRCNIDCDYCFMYHTEDQSWREKPKIISKETVRTAARRINQHAVEWSMKRVLVAFHGGEPLLIGTKRFAEFAEILREEISCEVELGVQTNGMLVNKDWIELFEKFGFTVGVSLDGDRKANDRHRLRFDGNSSYDDALKGLKLVLEASKYSQVFGGLLTVIDIENDPAQLLRFVDSLGVGKLDLLLPDGNHTFPPPALADAKGSTNYGEWLIECFDHWVKNYQHIEIRYFEEIIKMMLGGVSTLEAIGATNANLIIIETNGALEPVDSLKAAGRRATDIGLTVEQHSISDAMRHVAIYSRMLGKPGLCADCQSCVYVDNCAGGYIPHRYSHENGVLNPTVYCDSLKVLFRHISGYLKDATA